MTTSQPVEPDTFGRGNRMNEEPQSREETGHEEGNEK
jgi:hypothetical protein